MGSRSKTFLSSALTLFSLLVGLAGVTLIVSSSLAARDGSALYGGQPEDGYQQMGFMVIYEDTGAIDFCGAAFVGVRKGISAAHCFDKPGQRFVGIGTFTTDQSQLIRISSFSQKPGWDRQNSNHDVATFVTATDIKLPNVAYAQVTAPQGGCNYRVVAYGRTEDDITGISPNRPRKSAMVCISAQDTDLLSLTSEKGGICVGDSGSPIFEEGTNKFVGIISAVIRSNPNGPYCYIGNTALVPRLDRVTAFIKEPLVAPTNTLQEGFDEPPLHRVVFTTATALGLGTYVKGKENLVLLLLGIVISIVALLIFIARGHKEEIVEVVQLETTP